MSEWDYEKRYELVVFGFFWSMLLLLLLSLVQTHVSWCD